MATERDFSISELRQVELYFCHDWHGKKRANGHTTVHLCHQSQVETLVEASIKLHHGPGNPSTGKRLDNLWEIRVCGLVLQTVSYWWCSPDLKPHDPKAAKINVVAIGQRAWAHPELLAEEKRLEELED